MTFDLYNLRVPTYKGVPPPNRGFSSHAWNENIPFRFFNTIQILVFLIWYIYILLLVTWVYLWPHPLCTHETDEYFPQTILKPIVYNFVVGRIQNNWYGCQVKAITQFWIWPQSKFAEINLYFESYESLWFISIRWPILVLKDKYSISRKFTRCH